MEIFYTNSEVTKFHVHGLFRVTALWTDLNLEFSYFPQLWLLEWGCNGLKNVTVGLRDVKEGGISARKAGLLWDRLSMKKSTLQVSRLSRRVTFDRRIEVPSPSFFFEQKMKKNTRLQIG